MEKLPGRIVVHPRVLQKVAREVAASSLGVDRGSVSVDVLEGSHGVAIIVATPLPVPNLDDTDAVQAGEPVLAQVARIQEELRDGIGSLIGRYVARVDITITGALIAEKRRVR
jgi:hypothetical protein